MSEKTSISTALIQPQRALQVLAIYRLCLALSFLTLYHTTAPLVMHSANPMWFAQLAYAYAVVALIFVLLILKSTFPVKWNILSQCITDILFLTCIVYASGGIDSGFAILLYVAILASALLLNTRDTLLIATSAAVGLFFQEWLYVTNHATKTLPYTQMILIGISFFATGLLAHSFSRKLAINESIMRKKAHKFERLNQMHADILKHMQSGIMVLNEDNEIILMNDAAQSMMDITFENQFSFQGLSAELSQQLKTWYENPHVRNASFRPHPKAPDLIAGFFPLHTTQNHTLITLDKVSSLAKHNSAIKSATLGRLTASIAHELRNPLGAISHATQLLDESPSLSLEEKKLTHIVLTQANRMNSVIKSFLQLSRKRNATPHEIEIKPWLIQFTTELSTIINEPINCEIKVDPEELSINAVKNELHQVLSNICENGLRYSKKKTGENKILIKAGIDSISKSPCLDIIDYGEGVHDDEISSLFEPFHTTEKNGHGLGLFISKELCEANGAHLSCTRVTDGGMRFHIAFNSKSHGHTDE